MPVIMDANLQRDIGKHDAQIDALQSQVDRLHQDMKEVLDELKEIRSTLDNAKGGWRTLMMVGGAGAAIGGGLISLLHWFSSLPGGK